jgi:hypothetical protein
LGERHIYNSKKANEPAGEFHRGCGKENAPPRFVQRRPTQALQIPRGPALDSAQSLWNNHPSSFTNMGQQLNKYIKRKRRAAYMKRKRARLKAALAAKKK